MRLSHDVLEPPPLVNKDSLLRETSVRQRAALKNFAKFTAKQLCQSFFYTIKNCEKVFQSKFHTDEIFVYGRSELSKIKFAIPALTLFLKNSVMPLPTLTLGIFGLSLDYFAHFPIYSPKQLVFFYQGFLHGH